MTLEKIALWARRKGVDLIATGDCLQPIWLSDLERKLIETEPGIFALQPELDAAILAQLPQTLRRPLRFILSTEVHCAPTGTPELGGTHHLLYFPSFAAARKMHDRLIRYGNLNDGRPRLRLTPRQLLRAALNHEQGCQFAPAHVWNPFFSSFGSQSGAASLEALFGDAASHITLAETGLTSTPPMCRRFSPLDATALFSCSDAHSLENIGRECTRVDLEPSFAALFSTLSGDGPGHVLGTMKFPLERTRYYRNRCVRCQASFDGKRCPRCGSELIVGSRDRLEMIANHREPLLPPDSPPFVQVLPLRYLVAELCGCSPDSKAVDLHYDRLLREVGSERHVLTDATEDELRASAAPEVARAILVQRRIPPGRIVAQPAKPTADQLSLFDPETDSRNTIESTTSAAEMEKLYRDRLGVE